MEITYDKASDCLYIKLNDEHVAETDMGQKSGVIIDYSQNGTIIGLEILDASNKVTDLTAVNVRLL